MLKLHHILWPCLFAGILLLPGCKRPSYTPRSLHTICPTQQASQIQNNVTLSVCPLSKKEAKQLFDARGDRLISKRKPIHPILITIKNESTQVYTFDPKTIDHKLSNPHKVARRMYGHTGRRIIAPLILGSIGATMCFFGAAYLVILGAIKQGSILVTAGYSMLGISGIVAVSAPVVSYQHGSHSYVVNNKIDRDIRSKTVAKPIEIGPAQTTSFLLFVEQRHCPSEWHFTLTDTQGNALHYHICVQKGGAPCVC